MEDSGFMYMEVEGVEGLLVVPAGNLIAASCTWKWKVKKACW
jgi:hypothetical protein